MHTSAKSKENTLCAVVIGADSSSFKLKYKVHTCTLSSFILQHIVSCPLPWREFIEEFHGSGLS